MTSQLIVLIYNLAARESLREKVKISSGLVKVENPCFRVSCLLDPTHDLYFGSVSWTWPL
jgi:hypothetical protein